ncbi:hypothetical protein [Hyalangium versicolor]|uniref:hypothetical protein n=1 Tax=Hyalangium versicolor TaxID=2861190 RepID=UPI001CCDCB2E|nr:hypothetical protein [Hyalangium versicolor]
MADTFEGPARLYFQRGRVVTREDALAKARRSRFVDATAFLVFSGPWKSPRGRHSYVVLRWALFDRGSQCGAPIHVRADGRLELASWWERVSIDQVVSPADEAELMKQWAKVEGDQSHG